MPKTLLLCDCLGSQTPDRDALGTVSGVACSAVHTALCTRQADISAHAIAEGDAIIACGQERRRFEEMAEDLGVEAPLCVDLRDRAGWSDDGAEAGPKMAALLADALHPEPAVQSFDVTSDGSCLILGTADIALPAARQLAGALAVTVALENADEAPLEHAFDVVVGRLARASGSLGEFDLSFDALQEVEPGGRGAPTLTPPKDGARSRCSIILDLRGGTPLFPAPEKRDGYLRADPGRPQAVADALLAASDLVGTFEKPLYVRLAPELCAHSRAGQPACSNCLDACPTGAISPAGDHVSIDPTICAGCGACAALCPSGAFTTEDPDFRFLCGRMSRMARAYTEAGGAAPRLLVIDRVFGAEMVELAARFGRGLPADVVPLDLERLSGFGHAEILAALTSGFAAVDVLLAPKADRDTLEREVTLAQALAGGAPIRLLDVADPDALPEALYSDEGPAPAADPILALGSRRQVARLAAKALNPDATEPLPLPATAPYGATLVDTEACTLCLACASLCPAGALGDNPEMPQLRFQEDACLQCGLCVNVCPENAITLEPRMDLSDAALSQRVLSEEEPFACIECGKLFGSRSTIEKITEKLAGKHAMFTGNDATKLIQMCDDCRVRAQFHSENNPFSAGDRPAVRTTDDYLTKRRDH
ncbi:MAG: 4Fe-4S binding protein [Pseudomonadota bacterium]